MLRGVPLRIDRDEKRLNRFSGWPQTIHGESNLLKVGGTDIRTITIAEVDQQPSTAKIRVGSWSSRMGQRARRRRRPALGPTSGRPSASRLSHLWAPAPPQATYLRRP